MNLSRSALSYLTLTAALLINLARADDQLLCHWKSQTAPPPLEGHEGGSISDEYWFTHISDVDQEGTLNHFVFDIDNNHSRNFLPAEWRRSDGTVQIYFHNIKPGECGSNDLHTSAPFIEDTLAYINYGPIEQYKKVNAALYVPEIKPKAATITTTATSATPTLQSRIIATLQSQDGKTEYLQLEFGTEAEGKQFKYTLVNDGTQSVFFSVPALTEFWAQFAQRQSSNTKSTWPLEGDRYIARPKIPKTYALSVSKEFGVQEKQVLLEVELPTSHTSAAGQVTVYLPMEAK